MLPLEHPFILMILIIKNIGATEMLTKAEKLDIVVMNFKI